MELPEFFGDLWHLKVLWKWNEMLMELESEEMSWRGSMQRHTCICNNGKFENSYSAKGISIKQKLQEERKALEEKKSLAEVRTTLEERQQELDNRTGPALQAELDRQQRKLDDLWRLLDEQGRILEKEKEINFEEPSDKDGAVQAEKFFFRTQFCLMLGCEMQDVEDADVKLEMEEFLEDLHQMLLQELFEKLRWPSRILLQVEDKSVLSSEKELQQSSKSDEDKLQDLISQHPTFAKNKKWWDLYDQQLKIINSSRKLEERQRELDQQQMSEEEKSSEQKDIDEEWKDIYNQKAKLDERRWRDEILKKLHLQRLSVRLNRWLENSLLKERLLLRETTTSSGSMEPLPHLDRWYLNILWKLNEGQENLQKENSQSVDCGSVKALDEARRALEECQQQLDSRPGSQDPLDRQQLKLDDLCRLLDEQQWLRDIEGKSLDSNGKDEGEIQILQFFFRRKLSLMLLHEIQKLPEIPNVRKQLEKKIHEDVKQQSEQLIRKLQMLCNGGGYTGVVSVYSNPFFAPSSPIYSSGYPDGTCSSGYINGRQQQQQQQQQEQRLLCYLNNFCEDPCETHIAQNDILSLCQNLISLYPNLARGGRWWDLHEQHLKIMESSQDLEKRQMKLDRRRMRNLGKSSGQTDVCEAWRDIHNRKKMLDAERWNLDGRLKKLHLQRIVKRRKRRIEKLQQRRNVSIDETPIGTGCIEHQGNHAQNS